MTENAKRILEVVNSSHDHLTAEQIYLKLKEKNTKMVMATVYNNLATLYAQGLIRKVAVEGFPDRYDNATRHDHLVCKECGGLADITLTDLTEKLAQETGVSVLSYDLKISYVCEECARTQTSQTRSKQTDNALTKGAQK